MDIQRASHHERAWIDALLQASKLPPLPREISNSNVLVARSDGSLVGVIALEVVVRRGVVRSAAVVGEQRGKGIGGALLHGIVARAYELSLKEVYLLAEAAEGFFAKVGFEPISRDDVPAEIKRTREFQKDGPAGATAMRLALVTRL